MFFGTTKFLIKRASAKYSDPGMKRTRNDEGGEIQTMFHDESIMISMKENTNANKYTKKHDCSSWLEEGIKKSQGGVRDMKLIIIL